MFRSVQSRLLTWVAGTTGLLFAAAILYSFLVSRGIVLQDASELALMTAEARANEIEQVLRSVEEGARLLGSTLEQTTISPQELEGVLEAFVASNPQVFGSTAAVSPDWRPPYAPYFHRSGASIVRRDLATESYRYWEKDWFQQVVATGKPRWSEPYFDDGGGEVVMVTYSVPVTREIDGRKTLLGVVTADLSLEWLADVVESKVGTEGYAVILSSKGRVLAHPDRRFVELRESVADLEQPQRDPRVREIVEEMLRGEQGFVPFDDLYLGKRARAAFRPIGGAGWSIAVIFPEEELIADVKRLAGVELAILTVGLLALVGIVGVLSARLTRPLRELSESAAQIATGDLDLELPQVSSADEVGALTGAFHHMRDSLKTYVHDLEVTTRAKQKLESELAIARKIQMDMLPPGLAGGKRGDGYEIAATLLPARDVGGDLYDYFLAEGTLTFVVGDVSGKGVAAALFMARAKTTFEAVAKHERDLGKALGRVNRALSVENDQGMFVTLFAARLDLRTGTLSYAAAGHDAPVLLHGDGASPDSLPLDGGPVLGLLEESTYSTQSWKLAPGDALVIFTDGVGEAMNAEGEFFTIERLVELLSSDGKGTCQEITERVLGAVKDFAAGAPQSDDITIMVSRFLETTPR